MKVKTFLKAQNFNQFRQISSMLAPQAPSALLTTPSEKQH